jgi:hypothetical protein
MYFHCILINAQESEKKRTDISPYGAAYSNLSFSMSQIAPHGHLTQFTYFDINFVSQRFEDFLTNNDFLAQVGETEIEMSKPDKFIAKRFQKKAQYNSTKPRSILVKYNLFDNNGLLMVKSCEISGYWDYVIELYVYYWTTNMNFEAAKKAEVAVSFLLQDRIALTLNAVKEYGSILITNTTIKSSDQFKEIVDKNSQFNLKNSIDSLKQQHLKEIEAEKIQKEIERKKRQDAISAFIPQTYYVNVENLILRSSVNDDFDAIQILHAPAILKTVYSDKDANKNDVSSNFIYVEFNFAENHSGLSGSTYGWVMKKYIVKQKSEINFNATMPYDKDGNFIAKEYQDGNLHTDVESFQKYSYPKFKGGNEPKIMKSNKLKP